MRMTETLAMDRKTPIALRIPQLVSRKTGGWSMIR
jgi:hypothetical protein